MYCTPQLASLSFVLVLIQDELVAMVSSSHHM